MALSYVRLAIRNKQPPFYANLLKEAWPLKLTAVTKEQRNELTCRFI